MAAGAGLDLDPNEGGGFLGGLEALGQHDRDRLALPPDFRRGERQVRDRRRASRLAPAVAYRRGQHATTPGVASARGEVEAGHPARGDGRADDHGVQQAFGILVGGVLGRAA